ncbi:PHP domain-containing protein [Methanocella sp. MCL-LM]|uniref:PHP domain-containing protein n=1 Tax=Methanocella sp. MCL-LM TaxID=3412035 RepID=UPI003C784B38
MKIDTHVHTTCSDGRKTVAEVFQLASELDIRLISITDHDTVDGYPAALEEAGKAGIRLVPGVELSTRDEDDHVDVHVVGLRIDPDNGPLRSELKLLADARVDARRRLLDRINDYLSDRYDVWEPVSFENVRKRVSGTIVGKPHIAAEVLEAARKTGIEIPEEELYRIFKLPEVETKKAYELTMAECIRLIKASGGLPVLAHPFEYARPDAVMKKFKKLGGVGVELCKYRQKTKMRSIRAIEPFERIMIERQLNMKTVEMARRYGLKLTACSDYHAKNGEPGMETDEYSIDISWLLE